MQNHYVEKRLSLDLPEDYHEMITEMSRVFGFSTKTEAVRNFIQFYYEAMGLVLRGNEIVGLKQNGTTEITPMYGTALSTLARRIRVKNEEAAKRAAPKPEPSKAA